MNDIKKIQGFGMLEIIVSLMIFSLTILIVGSMYTMSQQSYNKGAGQSELVQNSRVSLDRISRELRQTVNIVTAVPTASTSPISEIKFQDGHDISQITYLRYYLDGTNLMRQYLAYEFEAEEGTYVLWDSVNESGDSPDELELGNRIIGEYFDNLGFWGEDGLVHITINLSKNKNSLDLDTSIFSRNW